MNLTPNPTHLVCSRYTQTVCSRYTRLSCSRIARAVLPLGVFQNLEFWKILLLKSFWKKTELSWIFKPTSNVATCIGLTIFTFVVFRCRYDRAVHRPGWHGFFQQRRVRHQRQDTLLGIKNRCLWNGVSQYRNESDVMRRCHPHVSVMYFLSPSKGMLWTEEFIVWKHTISVQLFTFFTIEYFTVIYFTPFIFFRIISFSIILYYHSAPVKCTASAADISSRLIDQCSQRALIYCLSRLVWFETSYD